MQLFKALQQKNSALVAEIARREQAEADRDIAHDQRQRADERLSMISQQEANRWGLKEGFVGKSKTVGKILEEVRQLQHVGTTGVLILGDHVKEQDSINNAECRTLLGVDLHRASYLLRKMYRAGLLARTGGHRGARYTLPGGVTEKKPTSVPVPSTCSRS